MWWVLIYNFIVVLVCLSVCMYLVVHATIKLDHLDQSTWNSLPTLIILCAFLQIQFVYHKCRTTPSSLIGALQNWNANDITYTSIFSYDCTAHCQLLLYRFRALAFTVLIKFYRYFLLYLRSLAKLVTSAWECSVRSRK